MVARDASPPPRLPKLETNNITSETPMQSICVDQSSKPTWKHLFAFTEPSHAPVLVTAVFTSCCSAALKSSLAIVLGKIFDIVAEFGNGQKDSHDTLADVSRWCLILVLMGIGVWGVNAAFLAFWLTFGDLQAKSVRKSLFNSLISLRNTWFDLLPQGTASLFINIQTQTRELRLATSQVFGLLVTDALTAVASLALALYYSWKLTLVLLATLPISLLVLSLASSRLEPAITKQKQNLEMASKQATAAMTAIDHVKVFNGYRHEVATYSNSIHHAAKSYITQTLCNAIQVGYVSFWVIAMFVIGFWYGLILVQQGLAPGHILTTFYSVLAAFQGLEALLPHWLVFSKGMHAGEFLSTVEKECTDPLNIEDAGDGLKPQYFVGDVQVQLVSFAYPSNMGVTALDRASFTFPAGQTTFVVGRSGSGKSTLGQLIGRVYEPLTGTIYFDGQPVKAFDTEWLHQNVTLVQQSTDIFTGTVHENIALGLIDPDAATPANVSDACQATQLLSDVRLLSDGLDTLVGEGGTKLSGGQLQRLALARARLRNPAVLIIDELTSALDQRNRQLVMESLRDWRKDKTTIIITHDISQIMNDDFVYVLDQGRLVQQGFRHDVEQQRNGIFASLARGNNEQPHPAITIEVTSPFSDASPISALPHHQSSVSRFIMGSLDVAPWQARQSYISSRASIGRATDAALSLRTKSLSATYNNDRPISRRSSAAMPSRHTSQQVVSGGYRFSTWVNERFDSPVLEKSLSTPWSVENKTSNDSIGTQSTIFPQPPCQPRKRTPSTAAIPAARRRAKSPEKSPETSPAASMLQILRTVFPHLSRSDQVILFLSLLCSFISAVTTPIFAYCLSKLLGAMWSPSDKASSGKTWALYLIAIAVIEGVSAGLGKYLSERAAQAWVNSIRLEAYERILHQPRTWFDKSRNSPGRVNESLDRNSEEMRNIFGRFVPIVLTVVIMVLTSVVWALVINWKLALVALAPLPLVVVAIKLYTIASEIWEKKCDAGAEESSAIVTEVFTNLKTVRAFTQEGYFGNKYTTSVDKTFSLGLRRAAYTCLPFGLYQSISYGLTALVFYYGTVLLTHTGNTSPTDILKVMNLLLFSIGASTDMLSTLPQITMAQNTAAKMLAFLDLPMSSSHSLSPPLPPSASSPFPIRLHNLSFSHGNHTILHNLSLNFSNAVTAIVGPSGSGKSTLLSLILGLSHPNFPPSLTYAGIPSSDVNIQRIRCSVGYVSQSPFLFPGSIASNITYGLPPSSALRHVSNVQRAARQAGIHEFISSLPEGYDTLVGDGGQDLSGGQAQRVNIARALVRKPQLLVLDEPTSALDTENAAIVRSTIREVAAQGLGLLMVTHNVDMMFSAENIIVLRDGRLCDQGTFDELMLSSDFFRGLIQRT